MSEFYLDPVSTAAAILSRYLKNVRDFEQEIELWPDKFGTLKEGVASIDGLGQTLIVGRDDESILLADCAIAFRRAQRASLEIDALRLENAIGYDELQKKDRS